VKIPRVFSSTLRLLGTSGLFLVTACSNPFSGHSTAIQNFHTPNLGCDSINLTSEHLDNTQLKAIVHCLNTNHQLQALEDLVFALPENDLTTFSSLVNETADRNPTWLYALKETYHYAEANQQLAPLEKNLTAVFVSPEKTKQLSEGLQAIAGPLAETLVKLTPHLQTKSLYLLAETKSYQRLVQENYHSDFFKKFFPPLFQYLKQKDSWSLSRLYQLLADHHLDEQYELILAGEDPKKSIQKLNSFFEWMFTEEHFSILSSAIRTLEQQPVTCFNGKQKIIDPLGTGMKAIAHLSAAQAKEYFTHDLKNLALISQGYCNFPLALDPLVQLLDSATRQPGFAEMFTLVKPLLNDDQLSQFLSTDASRTWVAQNQFLLQNHFFIDLFNLLAVTHQNALTTNGIELAQFLDASLVNLTPLTAQGLFESLAPLVSPDNHYGADPMKMIYAIVNEFPDLQAQAQPLATPALEKMVSDAFASPHLSATLDLAHALMQTQKLDSIIDQSLQFFNSFLNRASIQIDFTKLTYPALAKIKGLSWILPKLLPTPPAPLDQCNQLNVDWNFLAFTSTTSAEYLAHLSAIQACLNTNQTYQFASDLARYSIVKGTYPFLLSTQQSVLDQAFLLSSPLTMQAVNSMMALPKPGFDTIRGYVEDASQFDALSRDALLKLKSVREWLADEIRNPLTFHAGAEILKNPKEMMVDAIQPSIDLMTLSKMDTFITKDHFVANLELTDAINQLFQQYCPTGNSDDGSCLIDADQVDAFHASPVELVNDIKTEYLNSTQTWMHPKLFTRWDHTKDIPGKVSEFEYHLNPALHLLRNASATQGVLTAIKSMQEQNQSLVQFVREGATSLTLIPYIFQIPNYPSFGLGKREYSNHTRLRIVSDLDRLELMAINGDFKAFNLTSNFGMNFIKEVALAWGDAPPETWPKNLSSYKKMVVCDPSLEQGDTDCVRSLKQVTKYIEAQLGKYDTSFVPSLANFFDNNRLLDLSARLFNLRFMVTLLERELPTADGGKNGLPLLRTLFYSIYDSNSGDQRDQFPNGVHLDRHCLTTPTTLDEGSADLCVEDNLTLIARITRLGLMHEAGISILNNQKSPVIPFLELANRVALNDDFAQSLGNFVATNAGLSMVESGVDLGFTTKKSLGDDLGSLVTLLSYAKDQTWLMSSLDLVKDYPTVISAYSPVIQESLSDRFLNSSALNHYLRQHPESQLPAWLNSASSEFTHDVAMDVSKGLQVMAPHQKELTQIIAQIKSAPELNASEVRASFGDWFEILGSPSGDLPRDRMSTYVKNQNFDQFCDVFSDSEFVDKAYNFLESIHQNPDSSLFFQSCKEFLNLH
jgi:hypothetical protein